MFLIVPLFFCLYVVKLSTKFRNIRRRYLSKDLHWQAQWTIKDLCLPNSQSLKVVSAFNKVFAVVDACSEYCIDVRITDPLYREQVVRAVSWSRVMDLLWAPISQLIIFLTFAELLTAVRPCHIYRDNTKLEYSDGDSSTMAAAMYLSQVDNGHGKVRHFNSSLHLHST